MQNKYIMRQLILLQIGNQFLYMRDEQLLRLDTLVDRGSGMIVYENQRCLEIKDMRSVSNRVGNDASVNVICQGCTNMYCAACFDKQQSHQCETKISFQSNRINSQLDNTRSCHRCKLQQATCYCKNCNSYYFCQFCINLTHSTGKFILHHIIPLEASSQSLLARKVKNKYVYQNELIEHNRQINNNSNEKNNSSQQLATRMQLSQQATNQKKSQLKIMQLQVRAKWQHISSSIDRMFKQLHQILTDKHQSIKQSLTLHSSTTISEITSILMSYNQIDTELVNVKSILKDRSIIGQVNIENKLSQVDQSADNLQIRLANLLVKNDNLRLSRQFIDAFKQKVEEEIGSLTAQACITTAKYIVAGQDTETLSKSKSNIDLSSFSNKKKSSIKSINNPSCYNYNSSIKDSNKKSDNGMTIKKNITLSQKNNNSNTNKSTNCNNNNNTLSVSNNNMNARPKRRNISIQLCETEDNCQLQHQQHQHQQRTTTEPSNDDRRIKQLNRIKSFDFLSKNSVSGVIHDRQEQSKIVKKQSQCKRISIDDYFTIGDQKIELLSPQNKMCPVDSYRDVSEFSFIRNSKVEGESVIQETESIHFMTPSSENFPQIEKVMEKTMETARPRNEVTHHIPGSIMMNSPKANCTIGGKHKQPPSTPSTKQDFNKTFSSISVLKSPTNKTITQAFKSPKVKLKYPNQNKNEALNYLSQSNLKKQTVTKKNIGDQMLANG